MKYASGSSYSICKSLSIHRSLCCLVEPLLLQFWLFSCPPLMLYHRRGMWLTKLQWKFGTWVCECRTIFQTRFTKIVFFVYVCYLKKLQAHRNSVFTCANTQVENSFRNLNMHIHIRNLVAIDNPNILSNKWLQNLFAISNKTHANSLLLISFVLSNKELFSNLCTILKLS